MKMGLFSNSSRRQSASARAAKIERKIARKKKKLADQARLERARKEWAKMAGR